MSQIGQEMCETQSVKPILTEVCVDSIDGVAAAVAAGADRIELCVALSEGGLTPSWAMVERALQVCGRTEVNVLIRPRGGDFCYSATELQVMRSDIANAREQGAHAVVIGALTPAGRVDEAALGELLQAADSMPVTFHRAIDMAIDPIAAVELLKQYSVKRILTSGGCPTALQGARVIRQMVDEAGDELVILAGGGVRAHNVAQLISLAQVKEVHFTAFVTHDSPMTFRSPHLTLAADGSDYQRRRTDESVIRQLMDAIAG